MINRYLKKHLILGLIALFSIVLFSTDKARAGEAILSWAPNIESDLAGYKVYFRLVPNSFGSPIDVGNQNTYTVTSLGTGTYEFAVTAYDTSMNESGFSNIASKTFSGSDVTPPTFSTVQALNVTQNTAEIVWNTSEPATSLLEYGTTTAYGSTTTLDSSLLTSHSQTLSSLSPDTLYHFRVVSTDAAGNTAVSGDHIFTTQSSGTGGTISLINVGSAWSYLDDGSDQGTAWRNPDFNDSGWSAGNAELGYGDGDENTVVGFGPDNTNKYITTYFRTEFTVSDTAAIGVVNLDLLRDDGAVVYINGQEILRSNMPSGLITAGTVALSGAPVPNGSTFETFQISPGLLVNGRNVIAVEIHQASPTSSDISFNLSLSGTEADATPDTTSPVITNFSSISGNTSAIISWNTDEAASSIVEYGTSTAYGSASALGSVLVVNHSRTLTGLTPDTVYHYRVVSTDAAGNTAVSADNTFTTSPAPDTTAPVISGVTSSNVTENGAAITWSTDEAASSLVEYGTSTAYGSASALDPVLVTNHSRTLASLNPDTVYHYRVISTDAAGNTAVSADNTFTTSSVPDTTAPVISGIRVLKMNDTLAEITWETDEAASTQMEFGLTPTFGNSTTLETTLLTTHVQTLTGLQPGKLYYFRVKSADGAGNLSVSDTHFFTTLSAPDSTPPADILNFTAAPEGNQIRLSWINPSDADFTGVRIRFRTDGFPVNSEDGQLLGDITGQPDQVMTTTHSGLTPGATYYYSAASYDFSGNLQLTVYASATFSPSIGGSEDVGASGGCGMVFPTNGSPPGPGKAADMVGLLGIILISLFRKQIQSLMRPVKEGIAFALTGEKPQNHNMGTPLIPHLKPGYFLCKTLLGSENRWPLPYSFYFWVARAKSKQRALLLHLVDLMWVIRTLRVPQIYPGLLTPNRI